MRATKLISNWKSLPYRDKLEALRLPSMCYRRRGDTLQVYKIPKGIGGLKSNQFLSLADILNSKRHSLKLVKRHSRSSLRQHVFSQRVPNDWNELPEHVVDSPTLNTFQSGSDKHWVRERYNLL